MCSPQPVGGPGHKDGTHHPVTGNEHDVVTTHAGNRAVSYVEYSDGATNDEVLDVAWFANSITELDSKWADRWSRMEEMVGQMQSQQMAGFVACAKRHTDHASHLDGEIKKLNDRIGNEAEKATTRALNVNQRLESLTRRQLDIVKNQEDEKKTQVELKDNIIMDIQQKLVAATDEICKSRAVVGNGQVSEGDSCAARVANGYNGDGKTGGEIPSYFDMEKRGPKQRATDPDRWHAGARVRQGLTSTTSRRGETGAKDSDRHVEGSKQHGS